MKNHKGTTIVILVSLLVLLVGQMVYASTKEPGTAEDPLVTLSFVEQKLDQLKFYIDEKVKGVPQGAPQVEGGAALVVVELKAGQSLIAGQGTELILRAGTAVAIDSPLGGLSDVTGAKDIRNNQAIPTNHLLIVPRDDGRGVLAKENAVFMVRGGYTIKP